MDWIQHNTDPDALFLVEGYTIYGGTSIVGSDAGWWLPLQAHRSNTVPPQYALLNERPEQPGYSQKLIDLTTRLLKSPPNSPDGFLLLCDWNIRYIYVGQQEGLVGLGTTQLFSPQALDESDRFERIYAQDRVHIYAIKPFACQP
jgi:hypothetical protein